MSFLTYLLLVGVAKGTNGAFTPEFLTQALGRCLALQIVECLIIKFCLQMMQVSLPFLDIFAYTGYKYVALCINSIALVFGRTVYFLCMLVTAVILAYFVLKSMAAVVPASSKGPPRHLMLLGFAGLQFFVIIILSIL